MIKPRCPHCLVNLTRHSNKGVFQYRCPDCHGFSVHLGGLVTVMRRDAVRELWAIAQEAKSGAVDCSHCRNPMKVVYSGGSGIELDLCPRCNLVWLDTGEWQDLDKDPKEKPKLKGPENLEYGRLLLKMEQDKRQSQEKAVEVLEMGEMSGWKYAVSLLGIPVEKQEDHFRSSPWVTWLLILSCVLISIKGFYNMDWVLTQMAFRSDHPFFFKFASMLTSFFVHGHWLHLMGNMYFLWIFGDNVEDDLGQSRYIQLVLLSTVVGCLAFDWGHPSAIPLVGASGGISGIITYYVLRFPHRKFVVRFWMRWVSIPSLLLGALFFFKDFAGSMAEMSGSSSGVAHLAHLGGGLVGLVFAFVYSQRRQLRRPSKSGG